MDEQKRLFLCLCYSNEHFHFFFLWMKSDFLLQNNSNFP